MTPSSVENIGAEGLPVFPRPAGYATVLLIAGAVAAILAGAWVIVAGLTAIALAVTLIGTIALWMARGKSGNILIGWVFLYPLGYYLLSYPRERPIIQFDRILIACLLVAILTAPGSSFQKVPADLRRAGTAWAVFLAATCISLLMAKNVLTTGRLIVDGLLLPAVLGWYVVRQFRLRGHEKWLHTAICVISLYCAAIGVAEIAQQKDLLAFHASDDYLLTDTSDPAAFAFLRPNGPFLANQTFAIAGLISFFLLAFLWTEIRETAGPARRILHCAGISAALLQANLPVFRSVFLTLILVTMIDVFWTTGIRRALRLVALGILPAVAIAIGLLFPAVFQDRTDSSNFTSRLAQDRQTWRIFIDHPLFGVGLFNFTPIASANSHYQVALDNVSPLDFPHNNLGWVAAETGLAGTIPFVLAQILLVVAFCRLRKSGERGHTAWRFFVFIFLSYWLTGMTETAAQYGELNMWFIFAVALLYRYAALESRPDAPPALSPELEGAP